MYADKITLPIKNELWSRHFKECNEGLCKICNTLLTKKTFTWKYLFPKERGGRNNILNLIPICKDCDKRYKEIGNDLNLIN